MRAALLLMVAVAACASPSSTSPAAGSGPLLHEAPHGDGDSWKDTAGREYRLGMVNAPEVTECYGAQATKERQRLLAGGFRADVYSKDRYGRGVSEVTLPDGTSLNVLLARTGFVDDRYLAQFRDEKPDLAKRLDAAFAEAKRRHVGLWGACR